MNSATFVCVCFGWFLSTSICYHFLFVCFFSFVFLGGGGRGCVCFSCVKRTEVSVGA